MKKKWVLLKIGALFAILVSLLAFSSNRYRLREVRDVETTIDYASGNHFVTKSIIDTLLYASHPDYPNMQMKRVDMREMESLLNKDEFISSANVYLENDGILHAEVKQEIPVVRVHDGKDEYYITQSGKRVSLSPRFSARVFIIEGKIKPEDYDGLIKLINLINDDKLLKNLVIGIRKNKVNSFILLMDDGDYSVEIGSLKSLETKLENFTIFHKKYVEKVSEMPYKKLNLRFINQIVAIK